MSLVARRMRTLDQVAAGSFSPPSISNLGLWLDASDASSFTYSSGVVVAQWDDKSGNGFHAAQGTVARQPSRSGTQNGLSTVVFSGASNHYLSLGDVLDLGTADMSIFAVAKMDTTNEQTIIAKSKFGAGAGRWALYKNLGAMGGFYTDASNLRSAAAAYSGTGWNLFALQINRAAGAVNARMAQTQTATTSFTPESSNLNSAFYVLIGGYGDSSGTGGSTSSLALYGEIAEVVVYEKMVDGPELTAVESYLASKWAV